MSQKIYKIVMIGDSNTAGYGLESIKDTIPYKLEQLLGPGFEVFNMGLSGSCVINTLVEKEILGLPYIEQPTFEEALSIDGSLFVINLGTNDAKDGTEIDDLIDRPSRNLIHHKKRFVEDYMAILHSIEERHPLAKIMLCLPIPIRNCIWPGHKQVYLDMLVPYIKDISKKNAYPLIDLSTPITNSINPDIYYLDDGLHLNKKGADLVAKTILLEIENIL